MGEGGGMKANTMGPVGVALVVSMKPHRSPESQGHIPLFLSPPRDSHQGERPVEASLLPPPLLHWGLFCPAKEPL